MKRLLAPLVLTFTTASIAQASPAQVAATRDFIEQKGESDYIIVDKNDARFILVEGGQVVLNVPALLGAQIGDDLPVESRGTAASIFNNLWVLKDERAYSHYTYNTLIHFDCNQAVTECDAIHAMWTRNPEQNRAERLQSPTPADNRISNGCINLANDDFLRVLNFVQTRRSRNGGTPLMVIMPENPDVNLTINYLQSLTL